MAFDQRTDPPSASEEGYDDSRSTCSVTALYKDRRWGRYDRFGIRTIEGKRWGEKVLLPGMDREWTEDLLED
jgi:hypothetical protein